MGTVHFLLLTLAAATIAACRSAPASPTLTLAPTPTLTPFPAPELEPVLLRKTNFPARATSAQISFIPHPSFDTVPQPAYFVSALYANGTEFAGRVSFFFYANPQILDAAWTAVLDTVSTPKEITEIGELAAVDYSDIVFIRCQALVHIKLVGADPEEIRTFAGQLDAKLTPFLCLPQ